MKDVAKIIPRVMESYLETPRKPGDAFWSVREISRRFECTEYLAAEVLRKLTVENFIERIPGKGCFLLGHVDMKFLAMTVLRKHPGFVLPGWGHKSEQNAWTEYSQMMALETRRLGWDATFFGDSADWGDVNFALRFKMASCNVMVAMDPGDAALITFTELRREGIPVLSLGTLRSGYEKLGVVTLDRDEKEAMKVVMLQLFERGVTRPVIVGNNGSYSSKQRYAGCAEAFLTSKGTKPGDIFLEDPNDRDQLLRSLRSRLEARRAPDALIFHDSDLFSVALTEIPQLSAVINGGVPVVVFDDLHVSDKWPDLPIVKIDIAIDEIARQTIRIIDLLASGKPAELRTLVPAAIKWPKAHGG